MNCQHCGEPIHSWEHLYLGIMNAQLHYECGIRMVIGSVEHQRRACACFGGQAEEDPGKTTREHARRACVYYFCHDPAFSPQPEDFK